MPQRVDNETLHVLVSSSLWASELSLLQAPILSKLRAVLPRVTMLRFRVGVFTPPVDANPPVRIHRAELPADLEQAIAQVGDDELQAAIRSAAGYSLGRAESPPPRAKLGLFDKSGNKPF